MNKFFSVIVFILFLCPVSFSQSSSKKSWMYADISQKEMAILDTISNLREVRKERELLLQKFKGARILKQRIFKKPSKEFPFYWVKVTEDSQAVVSTHFNFYINPKTMEVKFFDPEHDTLLTLNDWRRTHRSNF